MTAPISAWDPTGPAYCSPKLTKRAAEIAALLHACLPVEEQILGVFAVTKISPALDVAAFTDQRLVAFDRKTLARGEGFPVDIEVADLASVEVSGFMTNVAAVCKDGKRTKLGNLSRTDDGPIFAAIATHVVDSQRRADPSDEDPVSAGPTRPDAATTVRLPQVPLPKGNVLYEPPPSLTEPSALTAGTADPEPSLADDDAAVTRHPRSREEPAQAAIPGPTPVTGPKDAPVPAGKYVLTPEYEPGADPSLASRPSVETTAPPASEKMAALEGLIRLRRAGQITAEEELAGRRAVFENW